MSERDIADEDAAPRGYAEGSRVVALIEAALAEVRADERARCEAERDELRAEVERLRRVVTCARDAVWIGPLTDDADAHAAVAALAHALDEVDGD